MINKDKQSIIKLKETTRTVITIREEVEELYAES